MKTSLSAFLLFLLALVPAAMFSGCQKSPINGDLDGMWQVMEVYPLPDEIILNERLYYNFYMHVCMLSYYGGSLTSGNMMYEDDKLYLDFPSANGQETIKILKQYGIYSNPVTFNIEYLDNKKMILSDGEIKVILRKF